MKLLKFECLRCGHCCIDLVDKTDLGHLGLYLEPEETNLFPQSHVFPLYGLGRKGRARPRPSVTLAYQLDSKVCPQFELKKKLCRIYSRRPLICRAFPVNSIGLASRDCTFIAKNVENKEVFTMHSDTIKMEAEANEKQRKTMAHTWNSIGGPFWVWPLNKRRWILQTQKRTSRFLRDHVAEHLWRLRNARLHL